jgi:hypothetical protein
MALASDMRARTAAVRASNPVHGGAVPLEDLGLLVVIVENVLYRLPAGICRGAEES